MAWSQAFVAGTTPSARSRHTSTIIDKKLFIIGGGDESRVFNDVYILDIGSHTFHFFFKILSYLIINLIFIFFVLSATFKF